MDDQEMPHDLDPHGYPTVKGCPICRRRMAAELRDQGTTATLEAQPDWADQAWAALLNLARTGRPFTADDLINQVGMPPGSPNAVGAIINKAAKRNIISSEGTAPSTRLASHLSIVKVWRGFRAPEEREQRLW